MSPRPDRTAHWAQVFHRRPQSGLSETEFCRREGISLSSMKIWI
jgi:hypothetical protein